MDKITNLICRFISRLLETPKAQIPVVRLPADNVNNVRVKAKLLKAR